MAVMQAVALAVMVVHLVVMATVVLAAKTVNKEIFHTIHKKKLCRMAQLFLFKYLFGQFFSRTRAFR